MGIGDKIANAARLAMRASGDLIEVSKLNIEISTNKEKIRQMKEEIGEFIFRTYMDGKPLDHELSIKCDEILDIEKIIDETNKKILEIKKVKKCFGCTEDVSVDVFYCPKCGTKLG